MAEIPDDVSGIADERHFAAFVRKYRPLDLFARFLGDPFEFLLSQAGDVLLSRDHVTLVEGMAITGLPYPLADTHYDWDDRVPESRYIITRVALYAPVTLRAWNPHADAHLLRGALTCVLANLNQPEEDREWRSWFDPDEDTPPRLMKPDLDLLRDRMRGVGRWLPTDYPPGTPEREGRATT